MKDIKSQYDRIIIDSAPVHVVSDAKILAALADTVVYVVKAKFNLTKCFKRGLKFVQTVNTPLAGVVLNHVDLAKAGHHDTYYSVYKQQYSYVSSREDA